MPVTPTTLGGIGANAIQAPMPTGAAPIVDQNGSLTDFGRQLIQALWNRTGQGPGLNSADINANAAQALTIAKAALPRAGGTMTGPLIGEDGGVWNGSGIGALTALGVDRPVPSIGDVDINGEYLVGGSQIAASNLSNGTTGTGAIVLAASPALTSVPTAPTASPGTNTTQIATTAFALAAAGGGVTPSALTEVNDTNVTLTLGGTPLTALLQAVSLTLGWTGFLAVGRGGTGVNINLTGLSNVFSLGVGTTAPSGGNISVTGTVNASQYDVGGSQISASNLSNGQTGSGAIVLANSPAFTGNPTGITALGINESTPGTGIINISGSYQVGGAQISTLNLSNGQTGTGTIVLSASPALTGTPTAPTASAGTNTTQVATTAFVETAVSGGGPGSGLYWALVAGGFP